jgi:hypothetical protein
LLLLASIVGSFNVIGHYEMIEVVLGPNFSRTSVDRGAPGLGSSAAGVPGLKIRQHSYFLGSRR